MSYSSQEYNEFHGTVKLTYDEFQKIPYDGLGHHLLNGVHIVTPAPSIRHQLISGKLFNELSNYVNKYDLGTVLSAPVDIKFSFSDGYQPDILYVEKNKMNIISENFIEGAPTLIIEITSKESSKSDYGWKKELAEKYNVKEFWIIDTIYKLVEIFDFIGKTKSTFVIGDKINSNLPELKKLKINVEELFL